MSKKAGAKARRDRVQPRGGGSAVARPESAALLPPFKPRRRLFYGLLTAFALWVGVLLGLYFFTVFPNRNRHTERLTDAPQRETVSR